ncbi:hypothetical protein SERLA73DRAFT_190644 [Serpula lacrymans var. lacrymans S7.3]|uniref:Ketoreductase (KR) domain-containing protein n=2 Tax=Serpula lacrymans var. lacrymans TaxID=341189 RepID=F8QG36_SERL3|nr:uncharacterized protein SERLADRAFT_463521 [Serpula lacrymans var. lacrymans S7.9]EGN92784.1 hypothetical protein SERLA73DRAFT_190644 [Serpula lacrymans var. lacrymans S7.3]EGO26443.1 hypothetical protein SERLADRAFT_463521 [Serpula lacrymans var. lacrymans S7.9]
MVLKMAEAAVNAILPSKYFVPTAVAILVVVVVHAFAQGRTTSRERDLHARTILITGGFTPSGLILIQSLAERGAHIIALSQKPIESPEVDILVTLLRSSTKNDQIFAEECDLTSPNSVRSFCMRFLTGKEQRLDALVFAHEYQHIGSIFSSDSVSSASEQRHEASLATFLIITLLLPALLVAPIERDIRIVNVVNPFYAAAAPSYSPVKPVAKSSSLFLHEGRRSLQMAIFTRHLQRILDALPSGAQVPKTEENTSTVHVVSERVQKSNIVAVSVCPGISRSDTIAPLLSADSNSVRSTTGIFFYILLQPFLRLLTKAPASAIQSILHVLFLPTPFKSAPLKSGPSDPVLGDALPEEVLKAGALYRECAVVNLKVPPLERPPSSLDSGKKGEEKDIPIPDDGEWGGVDLGQSVWEHFETALKEWEKAHPAPDEKPSQESSSPPESVVG